MKGNAVEKVIYGKEGGRKTTNDFLSVLQFNLTVVNRNSIIYYGFSKGKILCQLRKTGRLGKRSVASQKMLHFPPNCFFRRKN